MDSAPPASTWQNNRYPSLGWQHQPAQWQRFPLGHGSAPFTGGNAPSVQARALRQAAQIVGLSPELGDGSGFNNFVDGSATSFLPTPVLGSPKPSSTQVLRSEQPVGDRVSPPIDQTISRIGDGLINDETSNRTSDGTAIKKIARKPAKPTLPAPDALETDVHSPSETDISRRESVAKTFSPILDNRSEESPVESPKTIASQSESISLLQRYPLGQQTSLGFTQPVITTETSPVVLPLQPSSIPPGNRSVDPDDGPESVVSPKSGPATDMIETADSAADSPATDARLISPERADSLRRQEIFPTAFSDPDSPISDSLLQRSAGELDNIPGPAAEPPAVTNVTTDSGSESVLEQTVDNTIPTADTSEYISGDVAPIQRYSTEPVPEPETPVEPTSVTADLPARDNASLADQPSPATAELPLADGAPILPLQARLEDTLETPSEHPSNLEPEVSEPYNPNELSGITETIDPPTAPHTPSEEISPAIEPSAAMEPPSAEPATVQPSLLPSITNQALPESSDVDQPIADPAIEPSEPVVDMAPTSDAAQKIQRSQTDLTPKNPGSNLVSQDKISSQQQTSDSQTHQPVVEENISAAPAQLSPKQASPVISDRVSEQSIQPELPQADLSQTEPSQINLSKITLSQTEPAYRDLAADLPAADPLLSSQPSTQRSTSDLPIQTKQLSDAVSQPLGMHGSIIDNTDEISNKKTARSQPTSPTLSPVISPVQTKRSPADLISPRLQTLTSTYGLDQPEETFFSAMSSPALSTLTPSPPPLDQVNDDSLQEIGQTVSLSIADVVETAGNAAHISSGDSDDQALWQLAYVLYGELRMDVRSRLTSSTFQQASPGLMPVKATEKKQPYLPLALWPPPLHQLAATVRLQLQARLRQDVERSTRLSRFN